MSDAQIQKPDLWWWQKKTKNIKNVLQIFFLSDLVKKQVNLMVFYDSVVIIQRKLK